MLKRDKTAISRSHGSCGRWTWLGAVIGVSLSVLAACEGGREARLGSSAKQGFNEYAKLNDYNAFAYDPQGPWGFYVSAVTPETAIDWALQHCATHGSGCHVYAIGDTIVAGKTDAQQSEIVATYRRNVECRIPFFSATFPAVFHAWRRAGAQEFQSGTVSWDERECPVSPVRINLSDGAECEGRWWFIEPETAPRRYPSLGRIQVVCNDDRSFEGSYRFVEEGGRGTLKLESGNNMRMLAVYGDDVEAESLSEYYLGELWQKRTGEEYADLVTEYFAE